MLSFFGSCNIHILNTECAKIWKKIRRQKVKLNLMQETLVLRSPWEWI